MSPKPRLPWAGFIFPPQVPPLLTCSPRANHTGLLTVPKHAMLVLPQGLCTSCSLCLQGSACRPLQGYLALIIQDLEQMSPPRKALSFPLMDTCATLPVSSSHYISYHPGLFSSWHLVLSTVTFFIHLFNCLLTASTLECRFQELSDLVYLFTAVSLCREQCPALVVGTPILVG